MALSNEDSVDLPLAIVPPNGVPTHRKFDDTGEVHRAVAAAVDSEENTMEALAKLIISSRPKGGGDGGAGGGGGGGDVADKVLKDMKKHKWLAGVMALILGPGGMTATYYAIKDRSLANERNIVHMQEEMATDDVNQEAEAKEIRLIKVDIGKINTSIKQADEVHKEMLDGIKSLQQVNVTRLEKENEKLERELRRERNR